MGEDEEFALLLQSAVKARREVFESFRVESFRVPRGSRRHLSKRVALRGGFSHVQPFSDVFFFFCLPLFLQEFMGNEPLTQEDVANAREIVRL